MMRAWTKIPSIEEEKESYYERAGRMCWWARSAVELPEEHHHTSMMRLAEECLCTGLQHFAGSCCLEVAPTGSPCNDPVPAFAGIRTTEEWIMDVADVSWNGMSRNSPVKIWLQCVFIGKLGKFYRSQ